jgi:hypothetical protein
MTRLRMVRGYRIGDVMAKAQCISGSRGWTAGWLRLDKPQGNLSQRDRYVNYQGCQLRRKQRARNAGRHCVDGSARAAILFLELRT